MRSLRFIITPPASCHQKQERTAFVSQHSTSSDNSTAASTVGISPKCCKSPPKTWLKLFGVMNTGWCVMMWQIDSENLLCKSGTAKQQQQQHIRIILMLPLCSESGFFLLFHFLFVPLLVSVSNTLSDLKFTATQYFSANWVRRRIKPY